MGSDSEKENQSGAESDASVEVVRDRQKSGKRAPPKKSLSKVCLFTLYPLGGQNVL